jgi:MoaD family protein
MARVTFYGTFRRHTDDWQQEVSAATVDEALRSLTADNPALHDELFGEDDATLRPFVRVLVNGRDVELIADLQTPLEADDEVSVFSPVAGG